VKHISTTMGVEFIDMAPNRMSGLLSRILPRRVADAREQYKGVRLWWLEVDDVSGKPVREIGFDKDGTPITLGPTKQNYGCWVDSNVTIAEPDKYDQVTETEFEEAWNKCQRSF
jgi:hypothetical protein